MDVCQNCGDSPLPPRHSRYCARCSPLASKLWKRALRSRESRESKQAVPTWLLEGWPSQDAKRRYFREYMRARRQGKRLSRIPLEEASDERE